MEDRNILNSNVDKTIIHNNYTDRKPRGIASYEYDFLWPGEPSFGRSIYLSIIKGFASVFEYNGLPEEFNPYVFEMHLLQSGRMKTIKIGNKILPVHIVPKMYNQNGDWVESTIIEPYLPKLTGKKTETFKNVQFKNDVLGQSIIRLIYPFLEAIDDALFNLDINQKLIKGKLVWYKDGVTTIGSNTEDENAYNQELVNGKPGMILNKSMLDGKEFPIQILQADDVTQSYIDTIQFNFNQLLNVLGIPNNNAEGKKERMVVSEITIQNILQSSILQDMLNMRKQSINEFNKLYGLNASVEIRSDIEVSKKDVEDDRGDNNE